MSSLLLKVTPARVPRDLLVRRRLTTEDPQLRERPAVLVQAPAGFGKTSLLAQWRREHLARGTVVAWFSAQEEDDGQRLVQGLALAVRLASGKPGFGSTLLEGAVPPGLEGVTAWLAEVAQSALDIVIIIDEAERLPAESREALTYLIHNAPSNLRVVVAARPECDLGVAELVRYGHCATFGAAALRFSLDETIALARSRLGARVDADTGARLHELTEGWPLGLQLALSAISRSTEAKTAISAMAARGGELHERFVGALLANLDADDAEFLTRISIVDDLRADLCREMTAMPDARERLARLARDTPLLVAGEGSDWMRMHAVAREALRERFARLPPATRSGLQGRASQWLAEHGLLEEAARHALASGRRQTAYDYVERCLYENFMRRGQVDAVLDWLARLPPDELDRRPRLLLAAAWALAVGGRHQEAEAMVERILAQARGDPAIECECDLIRSGAAGFADNPDRFAELHDPWANSPPLTDPLLLYVHANRRAFRALFEGDPARARHAQQQAMRGDQGTAFRYVSRWGEFVIGLSYLWEGQVRLAENVLRPALAGAEDDLGRRNPFVCMLAALLAAAVWERDQPQEAAALLANRLDVLERTGLPDAVMLGYRTAARIASAEGAEHRAFELLDAMHAVGLSRRLPRLCIASLSDQVRMHARRFRPETSRALCARIDALLAGDDAPRGRLWRKSVEWMQHLAHANAAIAAQEWRKALDALDRTAALAQSMQYGRVRIEVMALRAFALDRIGEKSLPLLKEAIDLAQTFGLDRLFRDAHPALGDWVQQVQADDAGGAARAPLAAPLQAPRPGIAPRAIPSLALTPKEREVLELLARNLSNKEIARAMQIGEETIKWHLKNLFNKLDAGTRKQAVRRAELLGLLETAR
ncbi:MAG TPA: LuxR C-terminal-related transcriptional regulator [Burkholderiaceae bacterium]|nr:LuxR C-terminal-related transcriptional regulator [Burkholderiaceae bacterium]HQR70814.1 LuxR C-terminal-related transcriptional regulator [Burkholderiaceae bacterium]